MIRLYKLLGPKKILWSTENGIGWLRSTTMYVLFPASPFQVSSHHTVLSDMIWRLRNLGLHDVSTPGTLVIALALSPGSTEAEREQG